MNMSLKKIYKLFMHKYVGSLLINNLLINNQQKKLINNKFLEQK